jgi:hypothetical protein
MWLAVVHLSHAVDDPGIVQKALAHGGLAGVDVGYYADVADP